MGNISFKDPMILAVQAHTKTQTRRLGSPRYAVGDVLWCKQALVRDHDGYVRRSADYSLVGDAVVWPWKPAHLAAMYCPRWASKTSIEVTSVRVEPLQAITESDAWAEGIEALDGTYDEAAFCAHVKANGTGSYEDARALFAFLWDLINARKAPWSSNPEVVVYGFRVTP